MGLDGLVLRAMGRKGYALWICMRRHALLRKQAGGNGVPHDFRLGAC